MQKSLLISSFGHISFFLLLVFSGLELDKKIEPLPEPVQVSVISTSEFDAKLSVAPDLIFEKLLKQPDYRENKIESPQIQIENVPTSMPDSIKKLELNVDDKSFVSNADTNDLKVEKTKIISLQQPKKLKSPDMNIMRDIEGNEKNSYTSPVIAKPNPRSADRIDKIAVSKSSSEKVVESAQKAIKVANDALKVKKISEAEAPKAASTKITPEGQKNVQIIVSGAVQSSLPPPSRPKPVKRVTDPPIKRPKASDLLKKDKQSDQIEMLLAQVGSNSEQVTPEVSILEKNNMMSAIAQKLAKYWEQGILAGNSNFEKYIVQVEVEVNSLGEIIGGIKPLVPRVPKGRYLIAFRQASNALISAATLPIIPDKYPSGITFEITFDPEKGFSF